MNNDTVYITTKEGLKSALIDVLSDLKLIQIPDAEPKAPATRMEACKFLNISLPTLIKLIQSKQLPAFNIGNRVRIRWSDLEAYVNKADWTALKKESLKIYQISKLKTNIIQNWSGQIYEF